MDRGKWSQPGVPHKGWQCIDFDDLGGLDGICEMCETQSIRYVYHMEHPDYDGVLRVGSDCVENMGEDYTAPQGREKQAKSVADHRRRWMNAKWKTSAKGNSYLNRNGFNIVLYGIPGYWAYRIEEREGERSWRRSGFASEIAAKFAAFECHVELRE